MALFHNTFQQLLLLFTPLPCCLRASVIAQRSVQRCASTRNSLPFPCLCIVSLSLLSTLSASLFASPLCAPPQCQSHLLRPEVAAGCCFGYLVLLDHPVLLLFWRGLPGDHNGGPIVPALCHCNLTRRGTGSWGGVDKRLKKTHLHTWDWFFFPSKTACSVSPSPLIPFSCQNLPFISVWGCSWNENKGLIIKITMLLSENWVCLSQVLFVGK